ncbi:MAG: DMT family transporter [Candidatus Firestonebacteria bacterium]
MRDKTKGIWYGIIACVTWGTIWPLAKLMNYHYELDPYYFAAIRFLAAGLAVFIFIALRKDKTFWLTLKNHWLLALVLAFFGMFGMGSLVFLSIKHTTIVNSALLMNSNAIFIILFSLFIGEKINTAKAIAVTTGLLGCYLIINNGFALKLMSSETIKGDLMAVGASICWAAYTVIGRAKVKNVDSGHISSLNFLFGALMLFALIFFIKAPVSEALQPLPLAGIIYIGLIPTAYGFTIWYYALEHVEAGVLGLFQVIVPLMTAFSGVFFFNEKFTVYTFLGMLLILAGITVASRTGLESKK